MIIWSGWGILVALSLFAGGFAGMAVAHLLENFFGAAAWKFDNTLIFIGAALCNWGLGRFLYRKSVCTAMDPRTRKTYAVTPSHTLFFLPFRVYTFVFLGLAVFHIVRAAMEPPILDYTDENKARYQKILKRYSNKTGTSGGNTQGAIRAAKRFQETAIETEARKFESREISEKYGRHNFATYCFESGEAVVFITDVQNVRDYRDSDAKHALRLICRGIAEESAKREHIGRGLPLHVLIRDDYNTNAALIEKPDGGWRIDSSSNPDKRLIHLFDEETEPVKTELPPEAENKPEDTETQPSAKATEANPLGEKVNPVSPAAEKTTGPTSETPSPAPAPPASEPAKANTPGSAAKEDPAAVPENPLGQERVWTALDGRQMTAVFVAVDGDQVSFKKSDGAIYKFPLGKLSEADRELIRSHAK